VAFILANGRSTMKRVVTGWDESGRPAILFEGEPPTVMDFGPIVTTELWVTDSTPPDPKTRSDTSAGTWDLQPPDGGLAFRIVTFHPQSEADAAAVADGPGFLEAHATDTIDLIAVISGEITLVFEGREITLRSGDSVVQQGTPHDWINNGTEPCVVAGVLVSTRAETR
jgi:mannose-6-phosphate isomerase-like protein (cupin superfamily)